MLEELEMELLMKNKSVGSGVALMAAGIALMVTISTATGIALIAVGIALMATGAKKHSKSR